MHGKDKVHPYFNTLFLTYSVAIVSIRKYKLQTPTFPSYTSKLCALLLRMFESTSKHHKPSNTEKATVVDRISNLPDSILSHILSFLKTKEAAVTSILSSRRKLLWTLVPNLDLDDYEFPWISYPSDEEQSAESPDQDQDQSSFANVVSCILVLRKSNPLKKFQLDWRFECDPIHLDRWVRAAISHYLEELNLHLCLDEPFFLPSTLFSYANNISSSEIN